MTKLYESQYINILKELLNQPLELNERTGERTGRIPGVGMRIDLQKEFPILKSKQVGWKTALKEILWIMQTQSNNINDLNAHIWDQWADENGSIGKAYGYQVHKPVTITGKTYDSQVHYVLETLKNDPSNRRAVINLWDIEDLGEMSLTPCCYSSVWSVVDGKVNCLLVQRSADFCIGVPFNTTQYALLTHLFARHLGLRPGILSHVMADCHIYEKHIDGAIKQVENYNNIIDFSENESSTKEELFTEIENSHPYVEFSTDETNFFKIKLEDIHVNDYKHMGKINFDVAV